MDDNEFEQIEDVSTSSSGIDSSSFSSGDQLATPQNNSTPASNPVKDVIADKRSGREAYAKTLDNKNYYNDKLKENEKEKGKLDKEKEDLEKDNKEKSDALKDKDNALKDSQNKLNDAKNNFKNGGGILNKKGEQSSLKDRAANKIRENKEKRNNIKQNKNNVKDAKNQRDQAEKDKKESDNKLKDNENSLKKNELERKKLEKDKSKANKFAKLHPVEAAKMKAMHALKKLKKLIIVKILLPLLLIMVCIATLVMVIYEIFEKVDQLATAVANVVEKVDNFVNGLGFQNSEEAFYEELDELQKQYNNALDVPLLMSTLFYDDIQNNMDASSVQTDAISDGESMLSFATVFGWVKDKIKESQVTVGKDGYEYSSNKIYRLRLLAKKMVTKTGTNSKPWDEYLEMCAERIGKTIENFFSLENITEILLDFLTFGTWRIPTFAVSMAQMLDDSQVFETTNFYNMLTDNAFTDLLDIFVAVFETVSDIQGIEACLDGLVCIEYATYEKNDSEYYTYLKNYYIPRMPEFRKYIQVTDAANSEELIDKVIKEIKEIYNNYEEFFGIRRGEDEEYSATCVGNIKEDIVKNVRKPVDYTRTAVFTGAYAFGIYDRQKHNGLDLNSNTTGSVEGDSVFSIADNGVVMESTVDSTYKCESCKGGWVKISYSNTYNNKLYKFSVIYGGLSVDSLKLKKGDSVKKDDEIGKIGNSSESESGLPSLHFGFYDDDSKVFLDPTNIFNICSRSVRGNSMAEKMWWTLRDAGFSKEASAGVIGNAAAETGGGDIDHIITFSLENGESYEEVIKRDDRGFGLLGWTYRDFKNGLLDYAAFLGGNWYDEEVQLGYMVHSIKGDNSGATWDKRVWYISAENRRLGQTYEAFTGASTPEAAATIFCSFYERPAAGCLVHRETAARTAYDRFKDLQDPGTPVATEAARPNEANVRFIWPTKSTRVTSYFGYRNIDVEGATKNHRGIDIGGSIGDPIYSVASGKVYKIDRTEKRGNYILIKHDNGFMTRYQHLNKVLVSVGDTIQQGQVIAELGNTGIGSGPHLHFEIYRPDITPDLGWSSNTSNPLDYISPPNS